MIGIAPQDVPVLQHRTIDPVDAEQRFRAVAGDWIWDRFGDDRDRAKDYFIWKDRWHDAPYELLAKVFTRDELIRMWHDSVLSSDLCDHYREHDKLIWKVQNSLWRYGCDRDYTRYLACMAGLGRLDAGVADFDVRITHTRSFNTAAWSTHVNSYDPTVGIYLDAAFGALLYYKGKHVMTIGFALSRYGILLAQVQLREKRGNRFLYKLPMPYLDFAIDILQRAFPDDALWIVTGESTADAVRRAYHKNERDKFKAETATRIQRFYDQLLRCYRRTGETIKCGSDDGRAFARLALRWNGFDDGAAKDADGEHAQADLQRDLAVLAEREPRGAAHDCACNESDERTENRALAST